MQKSISILGCGWLGLPLGLALQRAGYSVGGSTTQAQKMHTLQNVGIKPYLITFSPRAIGEHIDEFFQAEVLIISIPPKRKAGLTDVFLQQLESINDCIARGNVSKVVFVSSTSVYPDLNRAVTEEDADPDSYMVEAEHKFLLNKNFKTTIIRFAGLVGPQRHPGRFLAGKKDQRGGDSPVNIIHLDDCTAIIKKIITEEMWGEIFNASADEHPGRAEFYLKACADLGAEAPQFGKEKTDFKIVSNQKLKNRLNYQFLFPDPMTMTY